MKTCNLRLNSLTARPLSLRQPIRKPTRIASAVVEPAGATPEKTAPEKAEAAEPETEISPEKLARTEAIALDYEYGYRTRTAVSSLFDGGVASTNRQPAMGEIPMNGLMLGWANFKRELKGLRRFVRFSQFSEMKAKTSTTWFNRAGWTMHEGALSQLRALDEFLERNEVLSRLSPPAGLPSSRDAEGGIKQRTRDLQAALSRLTLSNKDVWDREEAMIKEGKGVKTPWFVKIPYLALCLLLDVLFDQRPIQRFWFLETVARMPYFSYISMLHLYESLGWWRAGTELRKIHAAEEYNELNHLLIMESLGGDQLWLDRFLAQHAAIVYYWILILLFFFSPALAYNFSELIEAHAVHTYGQFVDENEAALKELPPPRIAKEYYNSGDLYYYDEFRSSSFGKTDRQRPKCDTLFDVFSNIRDDEGEHVKTMRACQEGSIVDDITRKKEAALKATEQYGSGYKRGG